MLVIPLLILALLAVATRRLLQRRRHPATAGAPATVAGAAPAPLLPETTVGSRGIGGLVLEFVNMALVNVVQVPFLHAVLYAVALALVGVARFRQHDRSVSVLVVLVVTAIGAAFGLLFLVGEVFIGHD